MVEKLTLATLVASLLFLGWQSRSVARQTRIANQTAVVACRFDALTLLQSVWRIFVEHPELRAYFYDGLEPPDDPLEDARVRTVAEIMADCLHAGLEAGRRLDPYDGDWTDFRREMLRSSPALRRCVSEDPGAWPAIAAELGGLDA